ncbi:succinyl-diaminopimelate desuccinylase [Paraneptunicella aestuarii]|uniref:succinyl-diaminopimelate desuccinylase n=1 Tax=Paraneptunicella aestuarii TaxID=2831148 RepID=UPI001E5564D1|nr:succinyl-diaminopimelate desuccinylase [Paraneptunicella aestuarii]UAA38026.1 succinyl-diaminopimelate desuccinylase [Paraneptunicella aestuarii]
MSGSTSVSSQDALSQEHVSNLYDDIHPLHSPLESAELADECHPAVSYSKELINRKSLTPEDAGCQMWLAEKLTHLGFEFHQFMSKDVSNFIAIYGNKGPLLAFCGHTDVVPVGDANKWLTDPFSGEIIEGELYGRGVTDMKGGIAAMLSAVERLIESGKVPDVRIMFLITSDEEGEADEGSIRIVEYLKSKNLLPDFCLIGEPSSREHSGDAMLVGRRGAISGQFDVIGKLGHVAYPTMHHNAAHHATRMMNALLQLEWDKGSPNFPGTTLQVTGIETGHFTDNLVPANCTVLFNVRYSHNYTEQEVRERIEETLNAVYEKFSMSWTRPCLPYITHLQEDEETLVKRLEKVIKQRCGRYPILCTTGGTSDGRFFTDICDQVVELGLPNKTIHQVNERVKVSDIIELEGIYYDLLSSF